jgi:Big-like domain-containing protein
VDDPPDARTDVGVTIPESAGPTAIAVLANDIELDGEALAITGKSNGAHGTVSITGGGTGLTYDPAQLYYGTDTFTYTVTDGHTSDTATVLLTVVKDSTAPTVSAPGAAFYAQTVASSTTRVRISWSGSDGATGTGITRYELQASVSGGAYANVTLAHPTDRSINRTQTDEKSYRYRVRARDAQGNVGAWVYGPTFKPGRLQNTSSSIVYAGAWATVANASALGGSHRYASSTSARASLTRSVRDFAFVATKTPDSGSVTVLIDNVVVATINLKASTVYRQAVYTKHFPSLGTHRIEIRPAGGGRVYLDAFLIMR